MAKKPALKSRGNVIMVGRGRVAFVQSDPTKVIARRGKRVAVNKKRYAVSVGERVAKTNKTTIKRRGKKVIVTKKVRSI